MSRQRLGNIDAVTVTRKRNQITLDLIPEFYGMSAFVLGYYLESLKQLYLHQFGHRVKFGEETQALYDQHYEAAQMRMACFSDAQRLLFEGVWSQIISPANGDLADNMSMLLYVEQIFALHRFDGDKSHKLVFTERYSGDRCGRILSMRDDIVALYGPEVSAHACSALREAIKRDQAMFTHFHGLTAVGQRESYLNKHPMKVRMLSWAFSDRLQQCSVEEIKKRFPQIVAIVRFLESDAAACEQAA